MAEDGSKGATMRLNQAWLSRSIAVLALTATLLLSTVVRATATERPDAWITTKVKIALLTTRGLSVPNIHVDTIDGRVTLYGIVSSSSEKARAEQIAKNVQGAREVRDLLQVVPSKSRPEVKLSDDQLKQRVADALRRDIALSEGSIHVKSVDAGVVLLAGRVVSLSEHLRAVQTAVRVEGVRGVASEIESPDVLADAEIWRDGKYDQEAYKRSPAHDTWIATAVRMRLFANPKTPAFDINVDSDEGVVTLFGVVESESVSQAAAAEARKVSGVRVVKNDLQVVPRAEQSVVTKSDERIKLAIEERIQERKELVNDKITVDVRDGVARLGGTVKTQGDRLVALVVTRTTTGVRGLVDELKVEEQEVTAR
jgi:hyperosmotically inducible protein